MAINIGDHSLVFLLGAQAITDKLQDLESQFGGLVEFTEQGTDAKPVSTNGAQPFVITYVPVNKSLPFYFEVRAIRDTGRGTVVYSVAWKPAVAATVSGQSVDGDLASVLSWFEQWVDLIEQYNTVRLSRKDRFTAESAQQFYDDFELVDEDANTAPFNNEKQIIVYKLLELIKDRLEQAGESDTEQVQEIVREIQLLQAHIPTITKAALLKEVSKIYAKVKAFSMQTFVAVYDVIKKEIIKKALYGGLDEASAFFHSIHLH